MPVDSTLEPQTNNKRDVIDLGAGDIELCIDNTIFKTHRYKLNKFSVLKDLIQRAGCLDKPRYIPAISVQRDTGSVEDFKNMFKVLYASIIKGPFTFEPPIFISALRISSACNYPALRVFSVAHLEKLSLSAVQRVALAREFQLVSWEGPALDELYKRERAITPDEAQVLGSDALAMIAREREKRLKKQEAELREAMTHVRREAEATKEALQRAHVAALAEVEMAGYDSIQRVRGEAYEQANRVARERDRREAAAKREAEKAKIEAIEQVRREARREAPMKETEALKQALEEAEKAKIKAIEKVRQEAKEEAKRLADRVASHWAAREAVEHADRVAWEREMRGQWAKEQEQEQEQAWKLPAREQVPVREQSSLSLQAILPGAIAMFVLLVSLVCALGFAK